MTNLTISLLSNGHSDSIASLSLSDRFLASGGDDGLVCLWSPMQSSSPVASISVSDPCSVVKFSVDKPNLLYSAHNRRIYSWDTRAMRRHLTNWKVNEDEINCLDILDSESKLAASDDTGAVQIIATDTGEVVRTLKKHDNICSSVKFRSNKPWQIISGGLDCRLIVSDWKGTGLGVMIFEMDELIDTNLSHEMNSVLNERTETAPLNHSTDYGSSSEENESDNEFTSYQMGDNVTNIQDGSTELLDLANRSDLCPDQSTPHTSHNGTGRTSPYANVFGRVEHVHSEVDEEEEEEDEEESDVDDTDERNVSAESVTGLHRQRRIHLNNTLTSGQGHVANAWSVGLPINPPMVHSVATTPSGACVAAGLESNTVELFTGDGKRLIHIESLYGHTRGVSALLCIGETHLVSGGNDCNLFVWQLAPNGSGQHVTFGAKVDSLEGRQLERVYATDFSSNIHVMDLTVC